MDRKPLEGLKVLDFCWVAMGPMTTKYLAEYGATVVRVESAKRPETLRTAAPFKDGVSGINRSGYFANNNPQQVWHHYRYASSQGQRPDIEHSTLGRPGHRELHPGHNGELGPGIPGTQECKSLESSCSVPRCWAGAVPLERQPGFGPVLASLAGMTHITGWPDRDPVNPYGAYTDFVVPRFAVAAILAALDYRRRTGDGTHLDISQLETSIHFSAPFMLDYAVNGREQDRMGNRDPDAAPHGVYPCKGEDRWIAIACTTDEEWQALCRVMDPTGQGKVHQERYSTLPGRKSEEDNLDGIIGEWTGGWDARELMEALQGAGVPAGMVNDSRDLFEDAQLTHREHFKYLDHPEIGPYASERSEFNLSRTPGSLDRPAPLIGEHTEYVLKDLFGLSDDEYRTLKDDGVLE